MISGNKNESKLAFIDLETTGFSPRKGDRIVEVSIINTDVDGNIIEEYETLINPLREVTATEIHQISASMLKNAPSFDEVTNDLLYHLNGKTIIGHNLSFDLRFLSHELSRSIKTDLLIEGVCTISLSKNLLPGLPFRRLDAFCEYFDISNDFAHSAFSDCFATIELYKCLRKIALEIGENKFYNLIEKPFYISGEFVSSGKYYKREQALDSIENENKLLISILKRLPNDPSDSVPVQEYLNLLDEVLADRLVTPQEAEGISDLIFEFGLSKSQVMDIHIQYLKNLIHVYYLDHILSESEKRDLIKVSEILGVSTELLQELIDEEFEKIELSKGNSLPQNHQIVLTNKSICFTGQLISTKNGNPISRSIAQSLALEHGMIIKSGVSSKLDYLVVADPNSLSGKSQKAREMGVKILAEPVFWQMMGYGVD